MITSSARVLFLVWFLGVAQQSLAQEDLKCVSPTAQELLDPPDAGGVGAKQNYRCLPGDITIAVENQTSQMSLKAFMHLNWPVADANGRPDYMKFIGNSNDYDNSPVWEAWKTTREIFDYKGRPPTPWGQGDQRLPDICRNLDIEEKKAQYVHAASVPSVLRPRYLENARDPQKHFVIDQDGEPLRYEVALNQVAFDYIVENKLYNAEGRRDWKPPDHNRPGQQVGVVRRISLPRGIFFGPTPGGEGRVPVRGSLVVKVAWKILSDKDDPDNFHKAWAYVRPLNEDGGLADNCDFRAVGLVAMHIMYKSKTLDNDWGFATFEHICVAPPPDLLEGQSGNVSSGTEQCPNGWLFYNPACGDDCLPINTHPGSKPGRKPSQIVADRAPLYYCKTCKLFSAKAMEMVKDSVWVKYQFVGTQWRDPNDDSRPFPTHITNAILEAYLPGNSSCIMCHDGAKFEGEVGASDSLFMFSLAPSQSN